MADEQNVVETWLNGVLNGDSDLNAAVPGGFWLESIPQEGEDGNPVPFPAGSFQMVSGVDTMVVNMRRIWVNSLWLVKVTAQSGAAQTLATAVSLVDELLHRTQNLNTADGYIYDCARESLFSQPVTEAGVEYRQRGALFRIHVRE